MYTRRVLIQDINGILNEIKENSKYKKQLKKLEIWSIDKFRKELKTTENTLFYACGHEFYEMIREMNENGETHIGLRGFDYLDFMQLAFVHLGSNRLVYDPTKDFYEYKAPEGKKTKKWFFSSELLEENYYNERPILEFFLSDECAKEYLKYPDTTIVGLKEGINVLSKLDKYTIHKYETTVNYDWYKNPEKRIWENEFGLDFETFNSYGTNKGKAFPEFYGTRCSGFALSWCNPETDEPKAIFFDFRLDYGYDEDKWNNDPKYKKDYYEFLKVFKSFMDNHYQHVWAYNASFEYAMLYALLRKFYYIQDSYALCIADDHRSSLKFNNQYYLRGPSWDDDLDADFDYFREICGEFSTFDDFVNYENKYYLYRDDSELYLNVDKIKSKLKKLKENEKKIKKEIRKKYNWKATENKEEIEEKFENTKCYSEISTLKEKLSFCENLNKKDPRFLEALKFFSEENPEKRMLLKEHWGDEWGATGVGLNNTEFGTKDNNCLGKYCGIDAFVGERLARLLMPAYGNNCYTEILNHRYIGSELKMCGIKVDKKRLLELYRFCFNVDNNYELSSNIFYQRLLEQNINPYHMEIYNELTDKQKFWMLKYPYYFGYGYSLTGSAVIMEAYENLKSEYTNKSKYIDYVPVQEIFKLIGKKISDKRKEELIQEYDLSSFTMEAYINGEKNLSEANKKTCLAFREKVGKIAFKYTNCGDITKKINEFAISIFKDKYIDFYDQTSVYWIYEDILPLKNTKVNIGEKDGSPNFLCLFDLLDDTKKSQKLLEQYFPDVTEDMLEKMRDIPEDLLEKFKMIVPIKDNNYINKYISIYPWEDFIPDIDTLFGLEYANDLPSYHYFKSDLNKIKMRDDIWQTTQEVSVLSLDKNKDTDNDNIIEKENIVVNSKERQKKPIVQKDIVLIDKNAANINLYESLIGNNGKRIIYDKEKIVNYFSPDQIDAYFSDFVSKYNYFDYGLATRSAALCFDKYVSYKNLNICKKLGDVDSKYIWKAMLEFLNNEEYRKIVLAEPLFTGKFVYTENDTDELKKEYNWFGKVDSNGYTKIDTVYNIDKWSTKDALDDCCKIYKILPHLFNTKTGIYNYFKVDGTILPPIIIEILDELPQENRQLYELQLSRIWDLVHQGYIRQLAATCHKLITTYIPALDMGYVKHFYKENLDETGKDTQYGNWEYFPEYTLGESKDGRKTLIGRKGLDYLYSEECENWFVNEIPDLWCLPPYVLNMVETKRNSSALKV